MKELFKQKKVLISTIGSLLLSIFMLVSASLAWMSMNRETTSNGMQLQVEASPSLIISNSTTEIVKPSITAINTNSPFAVTFGTNNNSYKPATHDSTYDTYPAGLKFVTNPGDVDVTTGLEKADATLTVTGVVPNVNPTSNPSTQTYYIDFLIYVASFAKPMENAKLKAQIVSAVKGEAEVVSGSLMATSIDVYAGNTISLANYRGTLNVANKSSSVYLFDATNHGATQTAETIPYNQADGTKYLTYTLRCYFDGALTSGGSAYINTATLDTSKVSLTVKFFVEE